MSAMPRHDSYMGSYHRAAGKAMYGQSNTEVCMADAAQLPEELTKNWTMMQ